MVIKMLKSSSQPLGELLRRGTFGTCDFLFGRKLQVATVTKAGLPQPLQWVQISRGHSFVQLLPALFQSNSYVRDALLDDLPEQRGHVHQASVIWVVEPRLDGDPVIWLKQEILSYVVNNDGSI